MLSINGSNVGECAGVRESGIYGDQLCRRVTINQLPDDVLLEIFGFYVACPLPPPFHEEDEWHTLVHVCRRWRYIVFGSPRRLDLRLLCINRRLVKTLDIWPELPIVIHINSDKFPQLPSVTSLISVLNRHDQVCKIFIGGVPNSLLNKIARAMSEPFPALIELELFSLEEYPPIVPDSFLGGSVPRLRSLKLWGIPFPGMGKLLLSTRDLVSLSLVFIPHSVYISPEALVPILSALTKLKSLRLHFTTRSWTHGASQRPLALTRTVLPALTNFSFCGDSEHLRDFVSRIDAPLDSITVTFLDEIADIPLLRDFIDRTKLLDAPHRAETSFSNIDSNISLFQRKGDVDFKVLSLSLEVPWSRSTLGSQPSSLAQACNSLLPPLPSLEHLGIYQYRLEPLSSRWLHEIDNTHWMELLRPFITVKDLVLGEPFVLSIAPTLQELVGERGTDILPALQNIFLECSQSSGPVPEGIAKFIAARERSGRPVIVHHRELSRYQLRRSIDAVCFSSD